MAALPDTLTIRIRPEFAPSQLRIRCAVAVLLVRLACWLVNGTPMRFRMETSP